MKIYARTCLEDIVTDPEGYNTYKANIRPHKSLLDVSLERKPGWRFTARYTLPIFRTNAYS